MKPNFRASTGSSSQASFFSRMKISLVLVCLFVIFTAGCASQVVYRINPYSPHKMGVREARDAVELALSLRIASNRNQSISFERDELLVTYSGIDARYGMMRVGYDDVGRVIWKAGNSFRIGMRFASGSHTLSGTSIFWKSEEDARLFLDGMYALRQWKIMDGKGMTAVATAPPPLRQTVIKTEEVPTETRLPLAKYHALFIAVQNYNSADFSSLDYTISDARRLRDILVSSYTFEKKNTIILENPDRRAIYKTLQALRNELTENDNLLIFFAGHGYWLDDMKQGFWLARDAAGMSDPSDWIPNSSVRDYIRAIKAKHILLISDACFSGGMFKVRAAIHRQQVSVDKIYELPSRKAITSGAMTIVPDRSVFLEYLIKRLKENKETYLDAQKLFASFREAVINNSPTNQTPLYGAISEAGDEGGDFIFVRRQ